MGTIRYLRVLPIFSLTLGFCLGCHTVPTHSGQAIMSGDGITTVLREPRAEDIKATMYVMQQGDVHATLTVTYPKDVSFHPVLQFEAKREKDNSPCSSNLPTSARFSLFQALFKHLLANEQAESSYVLYVNCYHEIDDRLPGLAAASSPWHAVEESKPSVKAQYDAIAKLLNDGKAMSELSRALDPFHYRAVITGGDLEAIWAKVRELTPEQRRLIEVPVQQNEVLPSSINHTFLITRD